MGGVVRTETEMVYIRGNVTKDATEIDYVDENGDTHCIDISTLMENFANCEIDLTINKISEENIFVFDREVIPATPVDQEDEVQIVPDDDNNNPNIDEDPTDVNDSSDNYNDNNCSGGDTVIDGND